MNLIKKIITTTLIFLFLINNSQASILFTSVYESLIIIPVAPKDSVTHIKIMVSGLACPFCAYGLEKKVKKIKGATDLFVEINEGYITFIVPADQIPSEEQLTKVVKEAGFTADKIEHSDQPFERPIKVKDKKQKKNSNK